MATKDAIKQALSQLDPKNDEHWTDDGLPRTSVVQRLANDPEIRRTDIQAVAPGFSRKAGDAMGEPQENVTAPGKPQAADETGPAAVQANAENELGGDDAKLAAQNRLMDAEEALTAAKATTAAAQKAERDATRELDAAKIDFAAKFPPMTAAENIKQHLAHQRELRAAAVGASGVYGADKIDLAFRNRRVNNGQRSGYERPVRPMVSGAR